MRSYLNLGGTVYTKYRAINDRVLEEFSAAYESGVEIHDRDLEEMGTVAAEELNIPTFVAGHHWVENFKRRNRIVDRKAKIVGKKKMQATQEAIDQFMSELRPVLAAVPANKVPTHSFSCS
jgi:hypothetical protein